MDSVFKLSNGDRVSYLHDLMHSFSASYICLWLHSPNLNFLYCEYGYLQEETSSSSGVSITQQLFNEYKQSPFTVDNDLVPGLAFRDRNPYLELQDLDLLRYASIETQRQFYQEAKIKTAIFLGCDKCEIELGMSNFTQNLKTKMQSLFPIMEHQRPTDQQSKPSSASSSQSMDSPEYPSFFYRFPGSSTFHLQDHQTINRENTPSTTIIDQQGNTLNIQSHIPMTTTTTTTRVHHHLHHPLLQNIQETSDAALTKAYLAVLSSHSSEKHCFPYQMRQRESAFSNYHQHSGQIRANLRRETLLKRAIRYYRGLNLRRIQDIGLQGGCRTSTTQLHHMISERRRREKINESFQALRSLLPQGTKKDKASVLRTTKEYLNTLKAQLSELRKRNQLLEEQLLTKRKSEPTNTNVDVFTDDDKNLAIKVTPVSESTSSGERMVELQVMLRGNNASVSDLVIRVLQFLNQVREASMTSMEANIAGVHDQVHTNWVTFRLRIEGNEWDEPAFVEALRRLLAHDFGS